MANQQFLINASGLTPNVVHYASLNAVPANPPETHVFTFDLQDGTGEVEMCEVLKQLFTGSHGAVATTVDEFTPPYCDRTRYEHQGKLR